MRELHDKARVECDDCGKRHEATFSHVDRFDPSVGVWSVYCDVEAPDAAAYYLDERVENRDADEGYRAWRNATLPEFEESYAYACTGSITCEPILDQHGRECERVNDEARVEFYTDLAAAQYAEAIAALAVERLTQ